MVPRWLLVCRMVILLVGEREEECLFSETLKSLGVYCDGGK